MTSLYKIYNLWLTKTCDSFVVITGKLISAQRSVEIISTILQTILSTDVVALICPRPFLKHANYLTS